MRETTQSNKVVSLRYPIQAPFYHTPGACYVLHGGLPSLVTGWSLITGRGGGATKREGGGRHVKFYPYEKGGGRNSFSHAEGGTQQVLG